MKAWRLAWTYARRELRAGFRGFYVFLACIALGTAAIAAVQSLSAGMGLTLHHNGRFILGGDIALRTVYQPATPAQLDFLRRKMKGVLSTVVETRAMARREDGAETALIELKAVDAFYPLYGALTFKDGTGKSLEGKTAQDMVVAPVDAKTWKESGDWGAAVDREVLDRLGLSVGDRLMIGEMAFRINGVIDREPDRLGSPRMSFAPRVMISSIPFTRTGLSGAGAQVYYDHRLLLPLVKTQPEMEEAADQIAKAFPDAQWRGRTCYDAQPRLKRMIDQLSRFLTLVALGTLVIGGVGISNAVRGALDAKAANIATLRCLGATAGFIARVYLSMILMLAGLGIGAGVVLGALAARGGQALITAQLSLVDLPALHPKALAVAAAFGLFSTLAFSLPALGRATAVSPRVLFRGVVDGLGRVPLKAALSALIFGQVVALLAVWTAGDPLLALGFVGAAVFALAAFAFYAWIVKAALRRLPAPRRPDLRLALANLHRPGNATFSVVLSLGLGLTALVATGLTQDSFSRLLARDLPAETPSFFFLDVEPEQKDAFTKLIQDLPGARNLEMAPSFRGRILAVNGRPAKEALKDPSAAWVVESDRGFTHAAQLPPRNTVLQGAWWDAAYNGPPLVSIATDVARAFQIGVGDSLTLGVYGAEVTARVASVREVPWTSFAMNFAVVFSPGLMSRAPANLMATVAVDPKAEDDTRRAVTRAFPNVTVIGVRDALNMAQTAVKAIAQAAALTSAVALAAGALVLSGAVAAARRRHAYDAAVLKMLGATRGRVLRTFLFEYGVLGVLAAAAASLFGVLAARGVAVAVLRIDAPPAWSAVAVAALASLAVALGAGFLGTWRIARQSPSSFLRNQ